MPKKGSFNLDILPSVIGVSSEAKEAETMAARARLLQWWSKHPWNWLMGEDLEERQITPLIRSKRLIWTTDERDQENPIKAFPNLEYLYRWICLLHDSDIRELLANKPRQVILTTTTLLYGDWLNRFYPSRATLLSKNTQELAEKLLKEKVRDIHDRLPEWVKAASPMSDSPLSRADYGVTKSRFYAVPENVAHRHAVGGTASVVIIDEAGLQAMFKQIMSKAAPMASKLVAITTAQFGHQGAADFKEMMEPNRVPTQLVPELVNPDGPWPEMDQPTSRYEARREIQLKGFKVRKTSRGFTVVDICLEADPNKRSPAVLEELERRQPSRRDYLREYRGDWTSPEGSCYYSEFDIYGGRRMYEQECRGLIPGQVVACGWDFGILNPSIAFGQKDPYTGRVWILRALRCPGADTFTLRDLVLVLRGQLSIDDLSPKTSAKVFQYLDRISADVRLPPWPWFDPGITFVDFSSMEALRTTATVEGEDAERYDSAVLEARGIYLTTLPVSVKARENIVRKQLRIMDDGYPGLLIDPACPEVLELFDGGLVYAAPTKANPQPDEPKRDAKYHDLHDALGYMVVGLVQNVSDAPLVVPEGAQPFRTLRRKPGRPNAQLKPGSWLRPGQTRVERGDRYSR